MALFGVRTDDTVISNNFIDDVSERLEGVNLAKNPFNGYAKRFLDDATDLVTVFNMKPLWPNFGPWVALISCVPIMLFTDWPWAVSKLFIIPLFFVGLSFFWSETFFYFSFIAGLKKAGYRGPIKKLKKNDLVDLLARRL